MVAPKPTLTPVGVLLAVISAILYGSSDFMGGLASRTERVLAVTWGSQIVGLVLVTSVSFVVPAPHVMGADLLTGAVSGMCGALGLLLLYRALAVGPMSVVAPCTAAMAAVVPALVGLLGGDRPGIAAGIGVIVAFPAIVLVARGPAENTTSTPDGVDPKVVAEALLSGVFFGLFMVAFARAKEGSGMWPGVAARVASISLLSLIALVTRTDLRTDRKSWRLIAGTGAFDISANMTYLLASRLGLLSLISVISAMYPASTVGLARVVLGERIGRLQALGLVLVAIAVALVAFGR